MNKNRQLDTATWEDTLDCWDDAIAKCASNDPSGKCSDPELLIDPENDSVKEIFEPYFKQMGYPIIYITKTGNTLTAKTDRFLSTAGNKASPQSIYNYQWDVPIIMQTENSKYIQWLRKAGNTNEEYSWTIDDMASIDPNANVWMRLRSSISNFQ